MPRDAFDTRALDGRYSDEGVLGPALSALAAPPIRDFPIVDEEAFVGLPGDIVRMIEPHTESDRAALLLSAHAFFGNCIGRGPHYRVEDSEHGANLFVLKIGDSAKARKGTGEDRVRSLFRHIDEEWTTRRLHTGLSSGEGVIWEVRDPITKIVKEGKGASAVMVEETTDHGVSDKRLMVIESEFAGALRVMQREGNILSRVLRDAWDRGNLATMTKNSPARATGACISVIGHTPRPSCGSAWIGPRWRTASATASCLLACAAQSFCRSAVAFLTMTCGRWRPGSGAPWSMREAYGRSRCRPKRLKVGGRSMAISRPTGPGSWAH